MDKPHFSPGILIVPDIKTSQVSPSFLPEISQEKLGIEIDSSSIGKVKPKVISFPREPGGPGH